MICSIPEVDLFDVTLFFGIFRNGCTVARNLQGIPRPQLKAGENYETELPVVPAACHIRVRDGTTAFG